MLAFARPVRRSFATLALLACLAPGITMADQPPVAPVRTVVDDFFGDKVPDDYRYMEDFKNPEVQAWVKGQAEYAERTLAAIPGRAALLKRIDELDAGAPYSIYGIARHPNGNLFYFKQLASENVAKIYIRDGRTDEERLLVDPEKFPKVSPEDHFSLTFFRIAPSGTQLLYGFAASGSEETVIRVFDIATNKDLPDSIDRIESEYAPPYWFPDGKSFAYGRRRKLPADAPETEGYKFTQSMRHVLGTDPDTDVVLFGSMAETSPPSGEVKFGEMDFPAVIITPGSEWAVGQVKHGDETDITIYATKLASLGTADVQWTKVCDRTDLVTEFTVHGDDIFLLTAANAPHFKVVRTSLASPNFASAATVVPPAEEYVVDSLAAAEDALYVGVLAGVPSKVFRVPYADGAPLEPIPLRADEPSAVVGGARPDLPGVFLRTSSWIRDGQIYRFDPAKNELVNTQLVPPGKFSAPEGLTATEVMVASHDGVKVPLSIVHRTDIKLDGTNPTLITGYGGYGYIFAMRYDPTNLAWLERGGVLATAHVRGGGVFGKEWHHAGRKSTKPNTWKDFLACAEYLVKERYTSPAKLAGEGRSAGGILIGRAITERPDLFAAANIAVGCTDMLRFETTMNGPPNIPEFGTVTIEDEYRGLKAMSTIHQIRAGEKYPAIILTHGINDPRVEPWESAKATAAFQAATGSGRPVLFRVDYHSGHGMGSTRAQRHEEDADIWSFFLWQFGDPAFQPK
ncbi:MAG: S9 family peptidase [Pirellula sp.]|nr:S9 family peptidase [Pirellula sp.]